MMSDNDKTVQAFTQLVLLGPPRLWAAWTDEERMALDKFVRLSLTQMAMRAAE